MCESQIFIMQASSYQRWLCAHVVLILFFVLEFTILSIDLGYVTFLIGLTSSRVSKDLKEVREGARHLSGGDHSTEGVSGQRALRGSKGPCVAGGQ